MHPTALLFDVNCTDATGGQAETAEAHIHHEKGVDLLREGKMSEAIVELRQAIAAGGSEPLIHLNLAIAYMNMKNWSTAEPILCGYLKNCPNDVMAHVRLGVVLQQLKKFKAALREFKQAAMLNPRCAAAFCHSGEVLAAMKHWEHAREAYQRALKLKPGYVAAVVGLADLNAQRGVADTAMELYAKALKLALPQHRGGIFVRMAKLLTAHSRWAEASRVLNEAIAAGEDEENINYELALAYLNLGRPDEARQQMQILQAMGSYLAVQLRPMLA